MTLSLATDISSSSENEADLDCDLEVVEVTIDTSILKEYDVVAPHSRNERRKRRKKRKATDKTTEVSTDSMQSDVQHESELLQ